MRVESHEEENNNHLLSTGHFSFDTAQGMVGLLGCKCQIFIHQHSQDRFYSQFCICAWDCLDSSALGLVELHGTLTGLPFKPAKVSLDGDTLEVPCSLQCVDGISQLGAVGKVAEHALNPTVHISNKDVNSVSPSTNL